MLIQNGNTVTELTEVGFATEKEMQHFCEKNLELLLGLTFITSEFHVAQFRFDTVAYHHESNAFIIIEYKNDRNFSVVDQGYSYIATLLNHKEAFVLKYNQVKHVSKALNDFDWTQVRVMFVAPRYTTYQLNSINFRDLPMELWRIKRYAHEIIQFEPIKPVDTSASIRGYVLQDHPTADNPQPLAPPEVVVYTEEDRLRDGSDASRELYAELHDFIISLDEGITLKPTKLYVGFIYRNHNLIDMKLQKGSIMVWFNVQFGLLDDPRELLKDVTHIGHHGSGDCQLKLTDRTHMSYIKDMIQSLYELRKA